MNISELVELDWEVRIYHVYCEINSCMDALANLSVKDVLIYSYSRYHIGMTIGTRPDGYLQKILAMDRVTHFNGSEFGTIRYMYLSLNLKQLNTLTLPLLLR